MGENTSAAPEAKIGQPPEGTKAPEKLTSAPDPSVALFQEIQNKGKPVLAAAQKQMDAARDAMA